MSRLYGHSLKKEGIPGVVSVVCCDWLSSRTTNVKRERLPHGNHGNLNRREA